MGRWEILSKSGHKNREICKKITQKHNQRIIKEKFAEWRINLSKQKKINQGCKILHKIHTKKTLLDYILRIQELKKKQLKKDENTKKAINFWYNKNLIKSFNSLNYYKQLMQYKKEIFAKSIAFNELKLTSKTYKSFKTYRKLKLFAKERKVKANIHIYNKRLLKVLYSFKLYPQMKQKMKITLEKFSTIYQKFVYRKYFQNLKQIAEKYNLRNKKLSELTENMMLKTRNRFFQQFFDALRQKSFSTAEIHYNKTLISKTANSIRGFIKILSKKRENDLKAKKFYQNLSKKHVLSTFKLIISEKKNVQKINKKLKKKLSKFCKKLLQILLKSAYRKFRVQVWIEKSDRFRKVHNKNFAFSRLKRYWEYQARKVEKDRKSKRFYANFWKKICFTKLKKNLINHIDKNMKISKIQNLHLLKLKNKAFIHFKSLLTIYEKKHDKQQKFTQKYTKEILKDAFKKLCYYKLKKKQQNSIILKFHENHVKLYKHKMLMKLREWTQDHQQTKSMKNALLELNKAHINKVKMQIYFAKLQEYSKNRQIKKIRLESALNAEKHILIKKFMNRWLKKYQEFKRLKLSYEISNQYRKVKLSEKVLTSLNLNVETIKTIRKKHNLAIKQWAKQKYKICFAHIKKYADSERRKKGELKNALEEHNADLRKNAIRKWLTVGFYWINKKTGYDNLLIKNQREYALALKYALFWRNKTLASRKQKQVKITDFTSPQQKLQFSAKKNLENLFEIPRKSPQKQAEERENEKTAKKKEFELMQWLNNIKKSNAKIISKTAVKIIQKTPPDKKNVEKRIKEIENEILQFSHMKNTYKLMQTEGKNKEDIQNLREKILNQQPKVKKLLDEIGTLKSVISSKKP